jgi:CRP/FNR family transcriptional regulator, cyclic AMP receptor protein
VLEHDPELGQRLSAEGFQAAAAACRAQVMTLQPGGVPGWPLCSEPAAGFHGFLVVEGLLSRRASMRGLKAAELLGPGDVLRPWDAHGRPLLEPETDWRIHQAASLAVLDRRFFEVSAPWPEIAWSLRDRDAQRLEALLTRLMIAQAPRIADRVHLLLWHLADRWGRVSPAGVSLPLRLSRALIADLVCTTRESTSRALSALVLHGLVECNGEGFLLRQRDQDHAFGSRGLTGAPAEV